MYPNYNRFISGKSMANKKLIGDLLEQGLNSEKIESTSTYLSLQQSWYLTYHDRRFIVFCYSFDCIGGQPIQKSSNLGETLLKGVRELFKMPVK